MRTDNSFSRLLAYSEVAERLAVNIAHCLDALLENSPKDIYITPEWIREIHRCIADELFSEWAGISALLMSRSRSPAAIPP